MNVVVADLGMAGLRPRTRAGLLIRGGTDSTCELVFTPVPVPPPERL